MRTGVFGRLLGNLDLPMSGTRVKWSPRLVYPGLREGEDLSRRSEPPKRASILARDGATIVSGPATARAPSAAGSAIAGQIGPPKTTAAKVAAYARGFPLSYPIGLGGLEAI